MKQYIKILFLSAILVFLGGKNFAQVVSVQWGDYVPGSFAGYGNHPDAAGSFYGAIGKTGGTVPARSAIVVLTLAPEAPWDGSSIVVPNGWEIDIDNTTPTNVVFVNTVDWVSDEPFFEIPVKAISPRTSTLLTVGTQVFNDGGAWTLHPDAPDKFTSVTVADVNLPVLLSAFNAIAENSIAKLTWSTTMETNSDRFEIERSKNGKNWIRIGSVASHKESNSLKNYSFDDKSPENGANLYRLKMVDLDNTFAYSSIRSVNIEGIPKDLSVYPNPSSDIVRLREPQNVATVSIMDLHGKTVYQTASVSKGEISVKNLTSGMYSVRIETKDGGQSVQKLVVAR